MADLPDDRVTADKPPFSYVGIDCFGPFLVKRAVAKLEVMLVMLSMTKSPQNEIFNEAYLLRIA